MSEYEEALLYVKKAETLVSIISGHNLTAELNFYHSLILTALYPTATPEKQQEYLAQIKGTTYNNIHKHHSNVITRKIQCLSEIMSSLTSRYS